MDDLTIPPEVVEAMARASCDDWYGEGTWDEVPHRNRTIALRAALAAARAMLAAWPGVSEYSFSDNLGTFPAIILPIQQETSNADH